MENEKVNINEVVSGLKNTVGLLSNFINQTKESLPQEQKDLIDNEFKKVQGDLSKAMENLNNFKL